MTKFRCWDEEIGEMLTVHAMTFDKKGVFAVMGIDCDGRFKDFNIRGRGLPPPYCILMEYTGLKERLGNTDRAKEIYQGDRLRLFHEGFPIERSIVTEPVKYDGGSWIVRTPVSVYTLRDLFYFESYNIEVLGFARHRAAAEVARGKFRAGV